MNVKHQIPCPYCAAQSIQMNAVAQKLKAQKDDHTRYGCANEHYFAVPTASVAVKAAA
jgi:hypothetical protein